MQSVPDKERVNWIQAWNYDDDLPNERALGYWKQFSRISNEIERKTTE